MYCFIFISNLFKKLLQIIDVIQYISTSQTKHLYFTRGSRVSSPSIFTMEQKNLVVTLTEKNQRIVKWLVSCWLFFLLISSFFFTYLFNFIEKNKSVLWFSIVLNMNNKKYKRKERKWKIESCENMQLRFFELKKSEICQYYKNLNYSH